MEQCFAEAAVDLVPPPARNEVREYPDTLMEGRIVEVLKGI
jgi:hypothetical protein